MIALKITGGVQFAMLEPDKRPIKKTVGGEPEILLLGADAVMLTNREGAAQGRPRNVIASLAAGVGVFGDAYIVGVEGDPYSGKYTDVPDRFHDLLELNDLV